LSARAAAAVIAIAIAGALFAPPARFAMETDLTVAEKRAERELARLVSPFDREVDIGVRLHVVVRDPNGEQLMPGKPCMRILRTYELGGILNTVEEPPRITGPSRDPVTWYCSEDQERVLFYDGPSSIVVRGSEGAGKSSLLAMVHYRWWLDLLGEGREVGQTAPTKARLKHVRLAMFQLYPTSWFDYTKNEQLMTFADGHRVQFVSAKIVSESQGSPLQGFTFSRGALDELQDHEPSVTDDLEARGRGAEGGIYQSIATCTASYKPAFRNLLARKYASGDWIEVLLLIANSPFVDPAFLERMKRVMTDREFRRRFFAENLPPEKLVYFNFSRERNLRKIPKNARHITSHVLRTRTNNPRHGLLAGHDPGRAKAGTVYLDAYEIRGIGEPVWWIRGEILHEHKTTEQAGYEILRGARRFHCNVRDDSPIVHVRAHPFGQSETKPGEDVYRILRRCGLDVRAAQQKVTRKAGAGLVSTGTGLILREDRVEMVNTLFLDAMGRTRLYVEEITQAQPAAPLLVAALEQLEREDDGSLPDPKKDIAHDLTDLPDGLGYGLWPWEKEMAISIRRELRRLLAQPGVG
jgi:hypothetical protein